MRRYDHRASKMLASACLMLLVGTTAHCLDKKLTSATAVMQANQIIQEIKTQRYTPELEQKVKDFINKLKADGFSKLADNVRGVLAEKTPPPLPPRDTTPIISELKKQINGLQTGIKNLQRKLKEQKEYYLKAGKQAIELTKQEKEDEIESLKQTIEDIKTSLHEMELAKKMEEALKRGIEEIHKMREQQPKEEEPVIVQMK